MKRLIAIFALMTAAFAISACEPSAPMPANAVEIDESLTTLDSDSNAAPLSVEAANDTSIPAGDPTDTGTVRG